MADSPFQHSRARIDRAGQVFREWWRSDDPADSVPAEEYEVVLSFRRAHELPMSTTTANLDRLLLDMSSEEWFMSNRLKRFPQILQKLDARPTLRLSTFNDVAGCRVVGPDPLLEDLLGMMQSTLDVLDVDDYRTRPRATGYRAVHVVVREAGCRVEVQLPTPTENRWAAWIEDLARINVLHFLKDGKGPDDVVELARAVSDELAAGTMSHEALEEIRVRLATRFAKCSSD